MFPRLIATLSLSLFSLSFQSLRATPLLDQLNAYKEDSFLSANERNFSHGLGIYSHLPVNGALISVGTIRSLSSFSISEAQELWVVDRDPNVYAMIRVFEAALLVTKTVTEFERALRLGVPIVQAVETSAKVPPELKQEVLSLFQSTYWDKIIDAIQTTFNLGIEGEPGESYFPSIGDSFHFWKNPFLYQRLKSAAEKGQIKARIIDLTLPLQVESLVRELNQLGLKLSAVDLSNSWAPSYVGSHVRDVFFRLVQGTQSEVNEPQLILSWLPFPRNDVLLNHRNHYSAFTFAELEGWRSGQSIDEFIDPAKNPAFEPILNQSSKLHFTCPALLTHEPFEP